MSFTARIADIALTVLRDPSPAFGSVLDGTGRRVSFPALLTGTSKDNAAAQLSALNARLAIPCDLVMLPTNSTYPQALHLLGGGVATITNADMFELGNAAMVSIDAPCAPHAEPANRVFLASPFGDEFPIHADVVANDEDKAFADGGRYAILAKTGDTYGTLTLYGNCTATELLIVENQYCNVSPAAATFVGDLTWLAAGGGAVGTEVKRIAYDTAGAMTPSFHKALYRVPATAVRFKIDYIFSAGIAGDALAYIWGVHVGEQIPACPMTPPYYLHSGAGHWESSTWPEHEFSRTTSGYCSWTHVTCYTIATCTHNVAQANLASLHYHPVVPNRRYGYRCSNQVTGFNSGEANCAVWWYDQDLNYITVTDTRARAADDGAVVETFVEVTAPEYASYAVPGAYVDIDSHLVFKVSAIQFGPHVMESPADIPLTTIPGESPAPIELWGDMDVVAASHGGVGTDAHAVWIGCGPNDLATHIIEAESMVGYGTAGVDALAYPTGGADNYIHVHEVIDGASIDTQALTRGTYLQLARVRTNAGHVGTFANSFDGGTTFEDAFTTALTTWEWREAGQVKAPAKRTKPGVAAYFSVTAVAEAAAGTACVDRYKLIPISFGGYACYHDLVAATDISDFDVVDGVILLDGVVDHTNCFGGMIEATKRDALYVVADMVAAAEITHALILAPLCTPQYSLWR